jgi:hypothetical protein
VYGGVVFFPLSDGCDVYAGSCTFGSHGGILLEYLQTDAGDGGVFAKDAFQDASGYVLKELGGGGHLRLYNKV